MNTSVIARLEKTRHLSHQNVKALCYAPFTNVYFNNFGMALVCCWSAKMPVGNVLTDSMDQIWHGRAISELRDLFVRYEFGAGCDFCLFQLAEGVVESARLTKFDRFQAAGFAPAHPRQMEFSISNVCNLECVMCNGDRSSAIRARREQRPPMARVYSKRFLDSLRSYLAELEQAKFLGGEPFLVTEHFYIWDMMIKDELNTRCHVTTNGTQYNDRIERYLDKLPFGFAVSLDAATKETYEQIRVGASFEEVMKNCRLFRDYARERNTSFSFTFCLMRQNWREFGTFCMMADQWDAGVTVNTVRWPQDMAVYSLPVADLARVVDGLESQAVELGRCLTRNKQVWFDEVQRIRAKLLARVGSD
jgi:molybdenum cofactor biosynthesis enzyme MoaA